VASATTRACTRDARRCDQLFSSPVVVLVDARRKDSRVAREAPLAGAVVAQATAAPAQWLTEVAVGAVAPTSSNCATCSDTPR
jgi:hypothetical protein